MMRGTDDLGVPVRKASPSRFPLYSSLLRRCGVPLQSLTRGSRSPITFLLWAVVLLSACGGDSGSTTEVNAGPVDDASTPVAHNCKDLPSSFASYTEAMEQIREATFRIAEEQNTEESSWVRGAEFYSCDGSSGFFILRTDDREYIHVEVPVAVWHGFKDASSFGTYYNAKIKRRYRLGLN